MAVTISERRIQMQKNFMWFHNAGYTILEIADKFNLSFSVVYRALQEIADENGVTRESLLQVVQGKHTTSEIEREVLQTRTSFSKLRRRLNDCTAAVKDVSATIDEILKEDCE